MTPVTKPTINPTPGYQRSNAPALAVVHVCPTCGGSGHLTKMPCSHDWRLVQSMGGENFNLQIYACRNDDCDAVLCSDCAAEGLEVCSKEDT